MTVLTRRYNLSLVHLIPQDYVGEECSRLHGHDFKLEVSIGREPQNGEVISRRELDTIVHEAVIEPFNQKLINAQISHGTGEVLAHEFANRLKATVLGSALFGVQIVETRNNRFQTLGRPPVANT